MLNSPSPIGSEESSLGSIFREIARVLQEMIPAIPWFRVNS